MPSTSSPLSQRLMRHPVTQQWTKEKEGSPHRLRPEDDGSPLHSSQTMSGSSAVLNFFLSTSPKQPSPRGAGSQRAGSDEGGSVAKPLAVRMRGDITNFEKSHGISEDQEEEDGTGDDGGDERDQANNRGTPADRGAARQGTRGAATVATLLPKPPVKLPAIASPRSRDNGGRPAAALKDGGMSAALSPSSAAASPAAKLVLNPVPALGGSAAIEDYPSVATQDWIPGKRIPILSSNPITAVFVKVPLYAVFGAFRDQFVRALKLRRFSQAVLGSAALAGSLSGSGMNQSLSFKKEPLRLGVDDLLEMLRVLVPDECHTISKEYARRMLEPFGTPNPYGPLRVPFTSVFSYLCKSFGHPQVERNIRFVFRVLDPKNRGFIPYSVVSSRIIRAWAENRVIGGAIFAWRAFASALEQAGDVDVRMLENAAQVTKDEFRMICFTTRELFEAMTVDLTCEVTATPRFPTVAKSGSDDVSSMHSGGSKNRRVW